MANRHECQFKFCCEQLQYYITSICDNKNKAPTNMNVRLPMRMQISICRNAKIVNLCINLNTITKNKKNKKHALIKHSTQPLCTARYKAAEHSVHHYLKFSILRYLKVHMFEQLKILPSIQS